MAKLLDANAILRYILDDIQEQSDKVEEVINDGAFTIPEVVAEVVYVLNGVYGVDRRKISVILRDFTNEIDIQDRGVVLSALEFYSQTNLDYVDCVLLARNKVLNDIVFTFDRKLKNKLENEE